MIVAAVEVVPLTASSGDPLGEILYVGAANRPALYTSRDRGQSWQATALTHLRVHAHLSAGVTALALDPVQQLLYVGTDNAGPFRVRITPAGLVSSAQLLLPDPVRQVAVDRLGRGIALIRTDTALYHGSEHGLRWLMVNTLPAAPTALAWLQGETPRILVGTASHGLLQSVDGIVWEQIEYDFGATVVVAALAADPLRPQTVYAAIYATVGNTSRVLHSENGGATWMPLRGETPGRITNFLPVSIRRGAVYALTTSDRTPYPLGNVPAQPPTAAQTSNGRPTTPAWLGWLAAGLATVALAFALLVDLVERRRRFPTTAVAPLPGTLPR